MLSYQPISKQTLPPPHRNHERDRPPPGRPVRQPDRCQVLGGEEPESRALLRVATAADSAPNIFFGQRQNARLDCGRFRRSMEEMGRSMVGMQLPRPGIRRVGPNCWEPSLVWPRIVGREESRGQIGPHRPPKSSTKCAGPCHPAAAWSVGIVGANSNVGTDQGDPRQYRTQIIRRSGMDGGGGGCSGGSIGRRAAASGGHTI